jgi:hypothetical protein
MRVAGAGVVVAIGAGAGTGTGGTSGGSSGATGTAVGGIIGAVSGGVSTGPTKEGAELDPPEGWIGSSIFVFLCAIGNGGRSECEIPMGLLYSKTR